MTKPSLFPFKPICTTEQATKYFEQVQQSAKPITHKFSTEYMIGLSTYGFEDYSAQQIGKGVCALNKYGYSAPNMSFQNITYNLFDNQIIEPYDSNSFDDLPPKATDSNKPMDFLV